MGRNVQFRNRYPGANMIHKIVLVHEDGHEVVLDTKPKSHCLDTTDDDRLKLSLSWDSHILADDAEEYLAVKNVWPGKESVRLEGRNGDVVFLGKVSGSYSEEGELGLRARQGSMVPGDVKLEVKEDTSDPSRMSVIVTADNFGEGGVSLDFGDGGAGGTNVGDGVTETKRVYTTAGTYTVTVTDVDQPERTATKEITVPFAAPVGDLEVVVEADPADPNGRRASVRVDNKGAGEVSISFGDGTPDGTNPGDNATLTSHDYVDGAYTLVVTDVDEPTRTVSKPVTIPFAQG